MNHSPQNKRGKTQGVTHSPGVGSLLGGCWRPLQLDEELDQNRGGGVSSRRLHVGDFGCGSGDRASLGGGCTQHTNT